MANALEQVAAATGEDTPASLAMDVLQGASNAVAATVAVPVDFLAELLRKTGIPVPDDPVGSMKWMQDRGLVVQPRNKLAGAIGEGLGGAATALIGRSAAGMKVNGR